MSTLRLHRTEANRFLSASGLIDATENIRNIFKSEMALDRETIFVSNSKAHYRIVLLIDDAVGSASTLNETAKKLKNMGIAEKVYGFALVGSLKGFEVVREV